MMLREFEIIIFGGSIFILTCFFRNLEIALFMFMSDKILIKLTSQTGWNFPRRVYLLKVFLKKIP